MSNSNQILSKLGGKEFMKRIKKSKRKDMRRFLKHCKSGNCICCPYKYQHDNNHCRLSDACKIDKTYGKYILHKKYGKFIKYSKLNDLRLRNMIIDFIVFLIILIIYAPLFNGYVRPWIESVSNSFIGLLVNGLFALIIGFSLGKYYQCKNERIERYWKESKLKPLEDKEMEREINERDGKRDKKSE